MCVHAKLLQSCPTLCNPMDCSLPGSSVHGILQARILEWVGCHALLQGIFLTHGLWDLPDPGIEPASSALQADSLQLSQIPKVTLQNISFWYFHPEKPNIANHTEIFHCLFSL